MMNKPTKWRKRHPRCRYCKHVYEIYSPQIEQDPFYDIYAPNVQISGKDTFYGCRAKGKFVNGNIPRIFCGAFEPKEYE